MTYPIILKPTSALTSGTFTISRGGKNKKTGASELIAFSHVCRLGLDDIKEDICVTISGHRYEPDLVYADEKKGIYIDIEIDEPYSGRRQPTHYITKEGIHKDAKRNEMFQHAGWHVVRFTEQQMFCQTKSCMKIVYDLINEAGGADKHPKSLNDAPTLKTENSWTADESIEKSNRKYRNTYLGYDPISMDFGSKVKCCMLILPIICQSLVNRRLRKMMTKQLRWYFSI